MPDLDIDAIKGNLNHKATQELVDILTFHLEDYDKRVVIVIEEILLTRGLSKEDVERAKSDYLKNKKLTSDKPVKKSFWEKAAYSLLFGIPLMLLGRWMGTKEAKFEHPTQVLTPWSPDYTKSLYKGVYDSFMQDTPDSTSDKLLANCTIDKLKAKYPKGVDSVNKDSLKATMRAYTKECLKSVNVHFYWSDRLDSTLRIDVMKKEWMQKVLPKYQKPLCDCYVDRLKDVYPNGFTSQELSDTVRDDILLYCVKKIKKR